MTKQEQSQPNYIYLSQDDLNIILDALNTLIQDTWIDQAYSKQGRDDALITIWSLLDSFFQLQKQNIRAGYPAVLRYQTISGDITITHCRKN